MLPLVLVLIVVGALVVIPIMSYTVSVLRANQVEQEHTRNVEAAKGGIRAALRQPRIAFGDKDRANAGCPDDPTELLPPGGGVVVTDVSVSVTCTPISELSANEVFGFEVPVGATQLQIAPDPSNFSQYSGILASSGEAPPYPTSGSDSEWAWWQSFNWINPLEPADVKSIWLPDLPSFTDQSRPSTPLDMPGFDCTVFLPGRYASPLVIDGSGASDNYYFASGVYYFEQPVTISGDVDVVVGQGLADFGVTNDCADDVQIGANVSVPANTIYGIDGNSGGATWVFGDQGRLMVSEAGGAPSIRFNQRYATSDRGGWANILSVNGDWSFDNGDVTDDDSFEDIDGNHTATNVNWVSRSRVLQSDAGGVITPVQLGEPGALYEPSHPDLTDEAEVPAAPGAVTGEARLVGADGVILITLRGVEGAATNGAIVTEYEAGVELGGSPPATPSPTSTCSTAGVDPSMFPIAEGADGVNLWGRAHPENGGDPDEYSCLISGLTPGSTYWVSARAMNEAGWSDWAPASQVPNTAWASAVPVTPASAPTNVAVRPYAGGGLLPSPALVSWDPPAAANGAPITGYDVEVYRVYAELVDPTPSTTSSTTSSTSSTTSTTTTTIPWILVEREELIDVAEAKCSTEPRMGVGPDEGLEWTPPPTQCVLASLPDMPDVGGDGWDNLGYRVKATARTAAGSSAAGSFEPPFKSIPGTPGDLDPAPPERVWFPHYDTSIISIDTTGADSTTIDIPSYVSVPMGRVTISNASGDPVSLTGGIVAGRFVVDDPRSTLTYGYVPSVIMQRTIQLTATAGNVVSTAVVKINSDTNYGILRWVTQ